ncbi:serine/threonine-protein kinase PknH/PknJ [Mycobacterium sp. 1164966.3]|uniref:serine/threonine-protein kinase PknH/PknJ n=1 Tax=Mycobacterium sp. 1164966.3 TaxID=1856861 RepID=UPI000B07F343|nr:serine/threonine-protein kinase PknH/PknJ [Mycobacterium sp. 1164966.3]
MDEVEFGRYRLLSLLGEGGMGQVWRAHDTVTDRVVAIKLLPPNLSKDQDFQRRFRREAHAAARLETPHVVPIHDYGEIAGRLFVCMRLIKGRDLAAVLAEGPLEPARAVRIIGQVAEALHAAHEIGLIHRDIKPSNILLDNRDFAYLIDFGIARAADDTRLTKTGNTIGTFAYIAPERLDGRPEDARADIYSLACVLYEALTGHPPFAGDTMGRLVAAHLSDPPPRPSADQPDVPAAVDRVIATGMAKDPDQRYATTVELADAARDAIAVPLARPAANPAFLAATEPAPNRFTAEPTLTATRQGGPPPSQPEPADEPLPEALPAPPRQRRQALIGAALLVAAVIAGIIITNVSHRPSTTSQPSATSTAAAPTTPAGPPLVVEGALEGLLLNPEQINTAMGTTGMTVNGDWVPTSMTGDYTTRVADKNCLPLFGPAEQAAYDGSGWTSVRNQQLRDSKYYKIKAGQAVVLLRSAHDASAFFTASAQQWPTCSKFAVTWEHHADLYSVGPVSNANGMLSANVDFGDGVGRCQRALTVVNNVVVDVESCIDSNDVRLLPGSAVAIAQQIAAKIPT